VVPRQHSTTVYLQLYVPHDIIHSLVIGVYTSKHPVSSCTS